MKRKIFILILFFVTLICALCFCACGSSDGNSENESGGGKVGIYTLGGIIVDANSTYEYFVDPNDMSYGEQNAYKQKISEYGENITVKDIGIDFDGLVLAQYNSAKYSMSGKNVVFSNLILQAEFTYVTLENGALSLCYTKDLTTRIVFEYYSDEYVAPSYKITFDYGENSDDSWITEKEVQFNTAVGDLPSPEIAGYTFNGWSFESPSVTAETKYKWKKDIVLVAKWIKLREYQLIFDYQGAQGITETKNVYYNTEIGALPQPAKAGGNTFGGWFTRVGGMGEEYTAETVLQLNDYYLSPVNLILYAKWDTNITFDYDGATSDNEVTSLAVVYNGAIATMPRPHKDGYSFDGWFNGDTEYRAGEIFTASGAVALKAKWIEGTDKDNFTYTQSNSGVNITGLSEKGKNLTSIVVPSQIDGKEVLRISSYAFKDANISVAVVPESVTGIEFGAFLGCPLTEITIPFVGGLPNEQVYGGTYFGYIFGRYRDTDSADLTNQSSGWEITYKFLIPKTLTKVTVTRADGLQSYGFYNCTMLTEININPETKVIPDKAFYNCGIVNFTIPEGVIDIGRGAFQNCGYLETLSVPLKGTYDANSFGYLNYLFGGTEYNGTNYVPSQLKTVIVTGSSTTVSQYAFYNCKNLNFITVDHDITEIGRQAFKGCSGLKAITMNCSAPALGTDALTDTPEDMILRVADEYKSSYQTTWNVDESRIFGQNKIYVQFDSRGGSEVDYLFADNGSKIAKPSDPRRNNYIFSGWYSDLTLKTKFDFNALVESDTVLYAKWVYVDIALDTEVTVDMNAYAGETHYFAFRPETSGYFTIRSYGDLDTTGILFNASGSQITSNSNGGTGISPNFKIRYQFTAGITYIIGVRLTSATATGEFKIMIYNG